MGQQQPGAGVNSKYIARIFLLSKSPSTSRHNQRTVSLSIPTNCISCVEPRPATQVTGQPPSPHCHQVTLWSHYAAPGVHWVSTQHKYRPSYIARHLFHIQLSPSGARNEWDDSTWGTHLSVTFQLFGQFCDILIFLTRVRMIYWPLNERWRWSVTYVIQIVLSLSQNICYTSLYLKLCFYMTHHKLSIVCCFHPINKNDCLLGCDRMVSVSNKGKSI